MTKINYEFIQKIFNRKIELKKQDDKIKLSKYSDYIPMYDIYSDNIYPISNLNIYYRLVDCHYRFITSEVKQWIENKLKKATNKDKINIYKKNLDILNNYDIDTLEKTSYQTLYRYSPELGLSISICKRNSFHPYARHLTPYYTKNELIKLGVNNKIIDKMTPESLVDKDLHYKICKTVSKNDVSVDMINKHMDHIIKNKCINWLNFYSMTGSYIFNDYLRNNTSIANYMLKGLSKIVNTMSTIDSFGDKFYFYRFIWDDNFLKKYKVGDIFIDKGFISTTRDPFYSPGTSVEFGLVLLKINVPKDMKGIGLFMENFSLFPKEEEFLICPNTKFKLVAKNDNFKYEHINKNFQKNITKKYEFDLIETDINFIKKLKPINDSYIPEIDLDNIELFGRDRIDLFNSFIQNCDDIEQFKYRGIIYQAMIFDSTSSYSKLYYNNTKEGLYIVQYKDGYPYFTIECGEQLVINFQKTLSLYDELINDNIKDMDHIIAMFGKLFGYEKAIIFNQYHNFTKFKDNYNDSITQNYLYTYLYCHPVYDYYKNNKKVKVSNLYKAVFGYWNLDKIGRIKVPEEITNKLPKDIKKNITWKDLFIEITEKYFYLYPRLEVWMNYHHKNIMKNIYFEFDILSYLSINGYDTYQLPMIMDNNQRRNKRLNIIFNRNVRRYD